MTFKYYSAESFESNDSDSSSIDLHDANLTDLSVNNVQSNSSVNAQHAVTANVQKAVTPGTLMKIYQFPIFGQIMSRNRFEIIFRALRFCDPNDTSFKKR